MLAEKPMLPRQLASALYTNENVTRNSLLATPVRVMVSTGSAVSVVPVSTGPSLVRRARERPVTAVAAAVAAVVAAVAAVVAVSAVAV